MRARDVIMRRDWAAHWPSGGERVRARIVMRTLTLVDRRVYSSEAIASTAGRKSCSYRASCSSRAEIRNTK